MSKIPKTIHYFWFGGKPLPELAERCIESWKEYFPEYNIKRWDESNFNVDMTSYTKQAYAAGKYAFVSDYARTWVLYRYGGVYFDTDVEVIASFDDILNKGAFLGREKGEDGLYMINFGLGMACEKGNSIFKEILDSYKEDAFIDERGKQNLSTVVVRVAEILKKYGLVETDDKQEIGGITIYPSEYFSPKEFATGKLIITDNTRSIHWYDASWQPKSSRIFYSVLRFMPNGFRKTMKNAARWVKSRRR